MVAPPSVMGLPTSGAEESSCHRSPLLSPSVLAQPSSSIVGKSLEEGESSSDEKYRKLLKDYHEVRALLCSSRLDADMLHIDSVATHAALDVAQQEAA